MAQYSVSEVIAKIRKQQRLTQMELSDEFIERGHLSRIENGKHMPKKQVLERLFEKLGYDPYSSVPIFMSKEEVEYQEMIDKLDGLLKNKKVEESEIIIQCLENDNKFTDNKLFKQCLLSRKASVKTMKNKEPSEIREVLIEAIKISIPYYEEKDIEGYLLTKEDIGIITKLAALYEKENRLDEAIKLLKSLKLNFDSRFIDKLSKGDCYPSVAYNLAKSLYRFGNYEEAIEACDEGIECCLNINITRLLPSIVLIKAYCLCEFGDNENCIVLLRQAYYSNEMYKRTDVLDNIKNYAQEKGLDVVFH